jgi:hypothetical protein
MRTSILSRSVVAVATLAIGSVALAATPATAASANGVTRDQVLTAVNGVRAAQANDTTRFSAATSRALRAIVVAGCDVSQDDDEYANLQGIEVANSGDDADGLLISAYVQRPFSGSELCTLAAFATTDTSSTLSGTATVTGDRRTYDAQSDEYTQVPFTQTSALASDAFLTPAIVSPNNGGNGYVSNTTAAASGNATKTTKVTTSTKVKDKKSKSEKKAAKKKFSKRLAQAKKNYAKALDKAGSSKSKKAAAKRVYAKARALAKAKYKYATAGYKIVKKSKTVTEVRPFSITTINAQNSGPNFPFGLS